MASNHFWLVGEILTRVDWLTLVTRTPQTFNTELVHIRQAPLTLLLTATQK